MTSEERKKLIDAYQQTIEDLEIAERSCGLFSFKDRRYYSNQILEFEAKILELKK